MTGDPQTAGTVFTDTKVDTRLPAPQPDAPVSSSDIIGANWTLSYQDMPGQPLQAEIDAYAPIINELDKRDTRTGIDRILGPQYLTGVTRGMPVNVTKVWNDVAAIRAKEPDFLKDIPASNYQEFAKWVRSRETAKRTGAQDVVRREQGFGQKALGFTTGIVSSFADPINLGSMVLTGPVSGGAKSLLSVMGRDAITNMAIETTELPSIASNRAQFGENMSAGDMLSDVATAGVAGGAFGGATRGLHVGGRYVGSAIGDSDLGRAGQQFLAPWALGRANLDQASDAEVARAFSDSVPFAARTPEAQAGLYVLDRDTEVAGASPYVATPGGLDANAERLTGTATAIGQPAMAGTVKPDVSRGTRPRDTVPLTQGRIIGFVLNDLEGGAKVVNNNDGGGTTKFGITQRWNPDVDVASLTEGQAASIARNKYWLPEFNRADPRVAAIAFDANYIATPALARRIIREAGDDVDRAMAIYREHLNHLAESDPGKARFKKAWNNRLDKLARFVGENEANVVRLAPEGFEGDDTAYRAAQDQLNGEELRLSVDGSFVPDPVRDFADRVGRGDDVSGAADARFATNYTDEIASEFGRRAELGVDGHPDPLGVPRETLGGVSQPAAPDLNAIANRVAELVRSDHSLAPDRLAQTIGTDPATARQALGLVAARPQSGLRVAKSTGRISRVPSFHGPKDIIRAIAEHGGIRDDVGHLLGKGGRDMGQVFVPGVGKLISNVHGDSIDGIGEFLHEAGYFPERPSEAEVLDALDRAVAGEKIYSLHDTAKVLDKMDAEGEHARDPWLDEAHSALIDRVPEEAIDNDLVDDVAWLIRSEGLDPGDAVSRAVVNRERATLDMIHDATEDADYDYRAAALAEPDTASGDPGRFDQSHNGSSVGAGDAGPGAEGVDAARGSALERSGGAATDAAEAAGLNGPPPLDPKVGGIDDAIGPDAARVADSLEHDVRAALDHGDQVDPAITERQAQEVALKAASPLQATSDQQGTIGLGLFDAHDQPDFMIELDGAERSVRDVLDEFDRDAAAIKAAKDCL